MPKCEKFLPDSNGELDWKHGWHHMVNGLEFIVYHINIHKAKYGTAYSLPSKYMQVTAKYRPVKIERMEQGERDKCPF